MLFGMLMVQPASQSGGEGISRCAVESGDEAEGMNKESQKLSVFHECHKRAEVRQLRRVIGKRMRYDGLMRKVNLGLSFSLSSSRLSASIQTMLTDNKHTELSHSFLICVFSLPDKNLKARRVVTDSLIPLSLKWAGVWEGSHRHLRWLHLTSPTQHASSRM